MALTDTVIRKSKAGEKRYKLTDGRGLFLLVQPSGGKVWHYKYSFAGKEKLLALGPYPDVTLAMARERHQQARRLVQSGIDPMAQRKAEKRAATSGPQESFQAMAQGVKARVFMSGRSQHVTIPAAFRFTTGEVYVHRDAATGDLILSPALKNWKEVFVAVDEAGFKDFLQDRDQGGYEKREPL
jgi:virulence-associated protein VagC